MSHDKRADRTELLRKSFRTEDGEQIPNER